MNRYNMKMRWHILLCPLICCVLFPLVCSGGKWRPRHVEPEYLDKLLREKRYRRFSKLLGIHDVNLVIPRKGSHTAEELMYRSTLKSGDIVPHPWDREKEHHNERRKGHGSKRKVRQAIDFGMYPGSMWNKTVPFHITTDFSSRDKNFILRTINLFNSLVQNIVFVPYRRSNDRNYVYFFSGNGCWSNLGKTGGAQALSLQRNGCLSTRTVLHEMVHALGVQHEQNRSDRDKYVRVLYRNIPVEFYSQYDKTQPPAFELVDEYDYYSIMHYPYVFPGERKPSFDILMPGIDTKRIGGDNFTVQDIQKIRKIYPTQQ